MKKNFRQVSILHVLHHGIMPISWWFGVRFVAGGFGTFHACLNSFIHFLMYLYYGLAALGPKYQKYLFWKKSMTWMQMVCYIEIKFEIYNFFLFLIFKIQFIVVMIHTLQLFFIECNYPILFAYWIFAYAIMFLLFFANFYVQAYKKEPLSTNTKSGSGQNKPHLNGYHKDE
jgi:elongation of very long chain fatty acids protein 7